MSERNGDVASGEFTLLAVAVGNTNTRVGLFKGSTLRWAERHPNADGAGVAARIVEVSRECGAGESAALVIASDNPPLSDRLLSGIGSSTEIKRYRIGADFSVPIKLALAPDAAPGQDRLLNALAAWETMQQACVVVDAGTAVTIDFVDGEGVFQGGAIAPGASLMLRALHEHTAALPEVTFEPPAPESFGKNTRQSMLQGVHWGIRGAVRMLIERYAEAYEAYPSVIATGSDAPLLFEGEELIDRIEPDLTLRGIECVYRHVLAQDQARCE